MSVSDGSVCGVSPPSCPASPEATARFVTTEWGGSVDLARWAPVLQRRERVIRGLRSAGDPRAADAVGWLTLAGILLDMPLSWVRRTASVVDPTAMARHVVLGSDLGVGAIDDAPDVATRQFRFSDGFVVVDAGSRSGWHLVQLAARIATGDVAVVGGTPLPPSAAKHVVRRRLQHALSLQVQR